MKISIRKALAATAISLLAAGAAWAESIKIGEMSSYSSAPQSTEAYLFHPG
ncbi:MAG: hypothetical protein ACLGIE_17385 [Alphaproteobacteria bacterium]